MFCVTCHAETTNGRMRCDRCLAGVAGAPPLSIPENDPRALQRPEDGLELERREPS